MTFTINATVIEVRPIVGGNEDGNTLVYLTAVAGEEVSRRGQVMQAVSSNTEGVFKRVLINLVIEGSDPPLARGEVVTLQGHFTAADQTIKKG